MFRRTVGKAARVIALTIVVGALTGVDPMTAQEPDSVAAATDTTDSLEAIEARLMGELGEADSADPATAASSPASTLNPDISLVTDFLVDLSPDEATLEGDERFQLREVELGVQGVVDPYVRYDAFLALHEGEIEVEEAYATTLALPLRLQARLGKFRLPFGKVNLTHRPELDTIDFPLVLQEFFGEEGLASTGVWASLLRAPLGWVQELSLLATEGAEPEEHAEDGDATDEGLLDDLADRLWLAHLKNSIDPSPATNLELGLSYGTSVLDEGPAEDAAGGRTNLYGFDATLRWKPPGRAKYRSAVVQFEAAWRRAVAEPESRFGGFVFGQWQLARRWFAGARYDRVERLASEDEILQAGQVLVRYFPTEFSQLRLAYERRIPDAGDAIDRLLVQTTFALGPHRPHAF